MNQLFYIKGALLILSVILIFRLSFVYFKANQPSKSLFYILFGGTILRLWCLSDNFLHAWDERYHALVAKNLIGHPLTPLLYKLPLLPYDYRQWTMNHVWLHKQPLSLWLMSSSIYVFGNVEWAVRLPSLMLSVACIYLTYLIAHYFTDVKTALLAAFLQSVNGLVIDLASGRQSTDHVDTTFLFFIELSIWFTVLYAEKRKISQLLGIGIAMGCAFLTKSFPALITLPIFFILIIRRNEWVKTLINSCIILVMALIIYLPWQVYIYVWFPQEAIFENQYNLLHLTEALEGHTGSVFWQLDYARIIWNELIYIVFIWFIVFVSKQFYNKKLLSLTIWLVVPYLFFSLVATKMIAYPLFTAPAIFIIEALFCWQLLDKPIKPVWLSKFLVIALIVLAARYGYERVKPFDNPSKDTRIATTIKNWQPIFSKNEKNVVFNVDNYIECMFYHNNCIAYPSIPQIKEIEDLHTLGYAIYMVNNSKIDSIKFSNLGIQFLQIDSID
jgi:4-amino-4-deoxy-L-arabinose transferase-like glycosyltransferase